MKYIKNGEALIISEIERGDWDGLIQQAFDLGLPAEPAKPAKRPPMDNYKGYLKHRILKEREDGKNDF